MWIVVPGFNLPTLVVAVAAPEYAPYLGPLALVTALPALRIAHAARRTAGAAAALAIVAAGLCALSVGGWVLAVHRADAAFAALRDDRGWPVSPYALLGREPQGQLRVRLAVPVPLREGGRLALDFFEPASPGPHPLVIAIYGGAWIFGARPELHGLARGLAREGYAVAVVDYRHAPQHRFPMQLHDVEDAVGAIAAHAAAWQIDRRRVAVLGRSAGAELALLLAAQPQALPIAAAVGLYAPIDLVEGYGDPPRPDPTDVRFILRTYIGGPPDPEHRAAYRAASPGAAVRPGLPPTLVAIGTADELVRVRFQREYVAALTRARVPVVGVELPFANHAFDGVPGGRGAAFERAVTLRFLRATLQKRETGRE